MRTVPLAELATIVSGATPSTSVSSYWDGDIPWVTPADLTHHDGIYFRGRPKRITKAGFNACSATMLPPGSILFSSRAPIGHCALLDYSACTNQGFKSIIPGERLDSVYAFFALKFVTPAIIAKGRGATFAEINKELMEGVQIPICDLPDQRRIGQLLRRSDHIRRMRRYALQMCDELLPAAFIEMFGDLDVNAKRWDTATLGDLIVSGPQNGLYKPASSYGTGTPILRIDAFHHGRLNPCALKRLRLNDSELASYLLNPNDLVINRVNSRTHLGKSLLIPPLPEPTVFESNMMRFAVDTKRLDHLFLAHQLETQFVNHQIQSAAKDAVNQASINQEDVQSFNIRLPPLPLQNQFHMISENHERLRACHVEALRQADHLFQTLLHQAFSVR